MLRHIKDIKSPIAVASAKHSARRDKRAANAGAGLDRPPALNRDGTSLSRPTRLHHPPVLFAVGKDKEKGGEGEEDDAGKLLSPREAPGYCISIYPYLAERESVLSLLLVMLLLISIRAGMNLMLRLVTVSRCVPAEDAS